MTRAHYRRLCLAVMIVLVLGGCASGKPRPDTLSAATATGRLSVHLEISAQGARQCRVASYRTVGLDGQPAVRGSRLCSAPIPPGRPVLIQARTSRQSIVLDVSPSGCGAVTAGRARGAQRPVVSRCSTGDPQFRATILPPVRHLRIVGIPGASVINFPRHPCREDICVTPLA